MSRAQIAGLVHYALTEPETHGKWSRFCLREGLTKDQVYHWRRKLGLPMRGSGESAARAVSVGETVKGT